MGSGHWASSNERLDNLIKSGGSKIQSLEKEALDLAGSDDKEDQLKAQQKMQQAQRMFELISSIIKMQGDMQKRAIENMR